MSLERSIPRYAHSEGHTDLCFSEDGKCMITCGSEGDIRIWNGFNDDDPVDKCVGEKALAVAQKGDKLYVGSDHNNVQIFTFPEAELDGILTRFTAPVTTINVSKDGSYIAAGSCDMEIRVIEIATSKISFFSGHKAPILHVSIDPKIEFLASSSCDGTVCVWNIKDQIVTKTWNDVVPRTNSFESAETICHISWEPATGRLLAIPVKSEIKIYLRGTWNLMITLTDNDISDKFGLTSWSMCGTFLAGSTVKGKIVIWNTVINKVVSSSYDKNEINICALSWNPSSQLKQLALCDVNGQLTVIENCCPSNTVPYMAPEVSKIDTAINVDVEFGDDFDCEKLEDEDDPETISLVKIKAEYNSFLQGDKASEKEPGDEDDNVSLTAPSAGPKSPKLRVTELQPPFQPTSTPVHLQRRFMVFNDVGYVKQTNTEYENMIDVDFHDASIHHAFRVNNILGHIMAALSPDALLLACEKTEESSSKVVCRLLNSWDDSKEWSTAMTDQESIVAIAVGDKWLAIATDLRYLRIFSLSGIQREIISLPGPVVSLNGLNNYLFVVYHNVFDYCEYPNLGFQIFNVTSNITAITPSQPLPMSPNSTLQWIGFSDESNPCALDSSGILKIFIYKLGSWRPICDVYEERKYHFIVGISEEKRNIRCILCKGGVRYPSTTPIPFITEIGWKIPVCENAVDKGIHEEKLWSAKIAKESLTKENKDLNKEILATALKLFALYCQTSHEMRAFESCEIINQPEFTELCLKYASRISNERLVERLSELRHDQLKIMEEDTSNMNTNFKNKSCEIQDSFGYKNTYEDPETDDYQSQELFSESKNTQDSLYSNDSSASLIIEMKKKKKSLSEQKNQVLPPRKINPFRKGLSKDAATPETQSSITLTKESQENANGSFTEWFKSEKNNLKEEFPNVSAAELLKLATKKFKENKSDSSIKENMKDNSPAESNVSKKRKSTDEDEGGKNPEKKKAIFKLQSFMFKKQNS